MQAFYSSPIGCYSGVHASYKRSHKLFVKTILKRFMTLWTSVQFVNKLSTKPQTYSQRLLARYFVHSMSKTIVSDREKNCKYFLAGKFQTPRHSISAQLITLMMDRLRGWTNAWRIIWHVPQMLPYQMGFMAANGRILVQYCLSLCFRVFYTFKKRLREFWVRVRVRLVSVNLGCQCVHYIPASVVPREPVNWIMKSEISPKFIYLFPNFVSPLPNFPCITVTSDLSWIRPSPSKNFPMDMNQPNHIKTRPHMQELKKSKNEYYQCYTQQMRSTGESAANARTTR